MLVALLALLATGTPSTIQLRLARQDYFLPPPRERSVVFELDARSSPPKTRIMFTSPLPAGRHRYRFEVTASRRDKTFVIATPVAIGRSSFEVSIAGAGRFDFGFWCGTKEYRFTVSAPVEGQVFELDFPAETIPRPADNKP